MISGAHGLIGAALWTSLVADGHRVLLLRRGGVTEGDEIGWDPIAGRIDAPALEGVDAVVHLAGEGIGERRWTDEQKHRIRDSRVRGTSVLAAAVASREHKPRVFVSASAIGYYGNRGDELLTEKSTAGDDFLSGVCRAWEAETQPAADAGERTVKTRTGIVLAAEAGVLPRLLLPFKLGIGGKQGSGKQWMSWITLDDEIAAIRIDIAAGSVYLAIMSFRDPIDKRSSARLFRDRDYSARVQANAGSEPRDPFWWSAVLATRAAFAARPGAKLISVPLHGGSLSVSAGGEWRASTPLPDDVAVQLDLYLPYCLSHPRGLAVAHIGQSLDGRIATANGDSRWITG